MRARAIALVCLLIATIPICVVHAHGVGPWGQRLLDWSNDQISQVISFGNSAQTISVAGKSCLAGGRLSFEVRNSYGFDIDETVWLDIEFYLEPHDSKLKIIYDRNDTSSDSAKGTRLVQLPNATTSPWHTLSIPLERARFANLLGGLLDGGADFVISAVDAGQNGFAKPLRQFTLCKLALRRSYTTPIPKVFGWAAIEIHDESGQPTPARMGIYDSSGRLPLPNDEAVVVRTMTGDTRVIELKHDLSPWPVKNLSVFYTDGWYHTRLPVGDYDLIVAKGPEYRFVRQRFRVQANKTQPINVKLRRWSALSSKGWYSGDNHIHYARKSEHDDYTLQLLARAEDLNVANILQIGNSVNTYHTQYSWKSVGANRQEPFALVPGQEDPRTSLRGHTIQLNIKTPVRYPEHYLLYHKIFENVRAQGGLVGYAHVTSGRHEVLHAVRGLAIDVPRGLVDFAEILSGDQSGVSTWFDFLNLGYKISPAAGTDFMGAGAPGAVRSYVKIDKEFTPQAWFDGLRKGHTFVTSGPMLEFRINGQGMGSQIQVKSGEPLVIEAEASINPDIDALTSLELIEQGTPVKAAASRSGAPEMTLRHTLSAKHGTWFVLHARAKNAQIRALSAPIYISVDGQSFWKRSQVSSIVANMKKEMQDLLKPNQLEAIEAWETWEFNAKHWDAQHGALKARIDQANVIYDDLAKRAAGKSE